MSVLDNLGINDGKEDISREDYACLLARLYAISLCRMIFTSPFQEHLDKEYESINKYMSKYKTRESDVIGRVRELIPETGWDRGLMNSLDAISNRMVDPKTSAEEKIKDMETLASYYLPDGVDRANLEDLLDRS